MSTLVEVKNLKKYFDTPRGMLHAVDDVSFGIEEGTTLGIVGESGCGKSTLGRTILHIWESTGGSIYFDGEDITHADRSKRRRLHENMQIIFQDPYSSLDPRMSVEEIIQEPLLVSRRYTREQLRKEADELMDMVGIDKRLRKSYPHELDGGRRQRVGIGRALALKPKFIVCDEPVSALDVSIQAQVLNLLQDLQEQRKLTYMFVTHNLSVVRHISDAICVMYLGQIVEKCPTLDLFETPLHPYTKALLSAIPSVDIHNQKVCEILQGELVSPIDPKPGCRFASRCKYAYDACQAPQRLEEVLPDHFVACCRARELRESGSFNFI
jgi:oligopeptide/dipeptide ABC transporter ATP-binding protein